MTKPNSKNHSEIREIGQIAGNWDRTSRTHFRGNGTILRFFRGTGSYSDYNVPSIMNLKAQSGTFPLKMSLTGADLAYSPNMNRYRFLASKALFWMNRSYTDYYMPCAAHFFPKKAPYCQQKRQKPAFLEGIPNTVFGTVWRIFGGAPQLCPFPV